MRFGSTSKHSRSSEVLTRHRGARRVCVQYILSVPPFVAMTTEEPYDYDIWYDRVDGLTMVRLEIEYDTNLPPFLTFEIMPTRDFALLWRENPVVHFPLTHGSPRIVGAKFKACAVNTTDDREAMAHYLCSPLNNRPRTSLQAAVAELRARNGEHFDAFILELEAPIEDSEEEEEVESHDAEDCESCMAAEKEAEEEDDEDDLTDGAPTRGGDDEEAHGCEEVTTIEESQ